MEPDGHQPRFLAPNPSYIMHKVNEVSEQLLCVDTRVIKNQKKSGDFLVTQGIEFPSRVCDVGFRVQREDNSKAELMYARIIKLGSRCSTVTYQSICLGVLKGSGVGQANFLPSVRDGGLSGTDGCFFSRAILSEISAHTQHSNPARTRRSQELLCNHYLCSAYIARGEVKMQINN